MPPALVEFVSVQKSYGGKPVLLGLDIDIFEGEFLTLLGPSGCGKTTVLRLLAGFEKPDRGEIRMDGQGVNDTPPELRPVNTVFQSYALFPHMTVAENVGFGLRMKRLPKSAIVRQVEEVLALVQLAGLGGRRPGQLSGGQQQRVALARAIINRPRILLLDESMSALDAHLRQSMQTELKALQRQLGLTFLFVTHDQEEALSMSDRVVVMRDGVIQQIGAPQEIYERPANLFVARFVGDCNVLEATVMARVAEDRVQVRCEQQVLTVPSRLPVVAGQRVHLMLRPEDLRVDAWSNDHAGETGLSGTLSGQTYKGVTLDTMIQLESGACMRATEFFNQNSRSADFSPGQRVALGWRPDSASILMG